VVGKKRKGVEETSTFTDSQGAQVMPRIKTKKKEPQRLTLRDLASHLQEIEDGLLQIRLKVANIWGLLYTAGVDELGPIKESEDDIPF
jgi:hypothetical protein